MNHKNDKNHINHKNQRMDSKRQQQIAKLIQQAMSDVFQVDGRALYGRAFVTISGVKMTPDLMMARTYLSVYNVEDKEEILANLRANIPYLRKKVGGKIRNKVRQIPELEFFLEDSIDEVFKIDQILQKIEEEREEDKPKKDEEE